MTILNPQYSFLEADYNNASLSHIKLENESTSGMIQGSIEAEKEVSKSLKSTIIWLLLKVNPVAPILVRVPADIYCIVFLMTGEWLTF
ncbi:hypothetical protein [Ureibacillus chungkukjangi]|uniref:Uncharacterized protein n=1 Tax=Ureibacillus chungkukjangi TaxID=1202712 RepID=A0A318U3I5_9BACL|nr:hypothetical protein [Ureibacillus chungkukjangi]PYF08945.1 hypothetical protein BJ095_101166 [Ureibacillus chungkukjangi]